jgi:hypothetical protein
MISLTERSGILLGQEDNMNAWLRMDGENQWLQISYRPENYPALNVNQISLTDAELVEHINKNFDTSWSIRKCNIEGVDLPVDNFA